MESFVGLSEIVAVILLLRAANQMREVVMYLENCVEQLERILGIEVDNG